MKEILNINEKLDWKYEAFFHKNQIQRLKQKLGKNCSYLSHVLENSKRFIKAVIKNNIGGKDTFLIEVKNDLSQKDYDDVFKSLSYERNTETV